MKKLICIALALIMLTAPRAWAEQPPIKLTYENTLLLTLTDSEIREFSDTDLGLFEYGVGTVYTVSREKTAGGYAYELVLECSSEAREAVKARLAESGIAVEDNKHFPEYSYVNLHQTEVYIEVDEDVCAGVKDAYDGSSVGVEYCGVFVTVDPDVIDEDDFVKNGFPRLNLTDVYAVESEPDEVYPTYTEQFEKGVKSSDHRYYLEAKWLHYTDWRYDDNIHPSYERLRYMADSMVTAVNTVASLEGVESVSYARQLMPPGAVQPFQKWSVEDDEIAEIGIIYPCVNSSDEYFSDTSCLITGKSLGETDVVIERHINGWARNEVHVTVYEKGDVSDNGAVDSFDAAYVLRANVKLLPNLSGKASHAADTNRDGSITAADASLILQYDVKLIPEL